jgi:hypothetical protein
MADAAGALPTRVVVRKLVFTAVGVFLVAAGITLMYEAMRAVMEVGGSCGSGGPYEIRQECPGGIGLMFVGIFGGLVGLAFVIAGTFADGPKLWVLAWPALFLSLGWNFLEYAFDPPPPDTGVVWGWLVCGVLFVAMGGIPLLFALWNAKLTLWGRNRAVGSSSTTAMATAIARLAGTAGARKPTTFVRYGDTTVTTATATTGPLKTEAAPEDDAGDGDLVSDLERLAALHRSGQLTDDEYTRAKDARLAEDQA